MRTLGPMTFKAKVDIAPYTIVRIVLGTTTTPLEVEPTQLTFPAAGIAPAGARAGGLVSVHPLNYAGYPLIRYDFDSGCEVGDLMYVTSTGTVTDYDTGGTTAGRAMDVITDQNVKVVRVASSGSGGFNRAADILVTDSAGNFAVFPKNIENVLQRIGGYYESGTLKFQAKTAGKISMGDPNLINIAYGGSRLSSDFLPIYYVGDKLNTPAMPVGQSLTAWKALLTYPSTAIQRLNIQRPDSQGIIVDEDHPVDFSIFRCWKHPSASVTTIEVNTRLLFPDGTVETLPEVEWTGTDEQIWEEFVFTSTNPKCATMPYYNIFIEPIMPQNPYPHWILGGKIYYYSKLSS